MLPDPPEPNIVGAASAMFWMRRLKAGNEMTKLRLMKPFSYQPAQPATALGRMKMTCAMQGMPRKGRIALARDYQNSPQA